MRSLLLAAVLFATAAEAHFRLVAPADWLVVTEPYADPAGGDQKTPPCGNGMETGAVTTLTAGQPFDVQWQETIMHPGWYRISLAQNRGDLLPGDATLDCTDAGYERTPMFPVLADAVEMHDTTLVGTQHFTITVPNMNCDACTLQVTEFMLNHGGNCFYWHCANVRIVGSDAGTAPDAGTGGGAGGGGASGGGAAGGGSGATGGGTGTGGGSGGGTGATGGSGAGQTEGECGCSGGAGSALGLLSLLTLVSARRRK